VKRPRKKRISSSAKTMTRRKKTKSGNKRTTGTTKLRRLRMSRTKVPHILNSSTRR